MTATETKNEYAYVESPAMRTAKLAIRKYVADAGNTGLESYGMVVHERVHHTDSVIIERSDKNVKTYRTGLNEFSHDIFNMPEGEEKQAKIRSIRKLLADAENLRITKDI